ncbi:hypothetical protein ASD99_17175 [Mesorhizobium sp. Root695]|jgi:uncharacterized protein YjiS (DUF1127 family)|uniref:DUF1127 domain-containing protein n=1 Tax=unclassified Mesorhizobium TaxID=325217 RepID=UPI00070022EB|nr:MULTISPECIES: DUF1127 domain-containing protein [unclassified Mesorhizobium]KQU83397.1 hypothetical protein ASD12_10280 [Mesorhizobium sp. Root102]KRB33548.1 hypothetical protein ASD99_17175 [Mesorhizobium sp. Root695]
MTETERVLISAREWRLPLTLLARLLRRWRHRRDRRHLETMPDFMLKDIGISRSEIDYVAAHGET